MIVHYTLTLADYKEALIAKGYGVRWLTYVALAYFGVLTLAIGIIARTVEQTLETDLLLLAFPIVALFVGVVLMKLMQWRQARTRRDIGLRSRIFLLLVFAVTFAIGTDLLLAPDSSSLLLHNRTLGFWWWAAPLGLVLCVAVISLLKPDANAESLWKGLEDQHRPTEFELLSDGVVFRDGLSNYQAHWTAFKSHMETANLFLIMPNCYSFIIVPKRAFANDDDRTRFREALKSITPPTGGFPVDLPEAKLQK